MSNLFPTAVYVLCFVTSSACALLLSRSYRTTRARLLLWSALCFTFLALNNLVVVVDLLLLPGLDLRLLRHALTTTAILILIFGFVWNAEE